MAIPTISTGGNVISADGTLSVPTKTGQANKVLKVNSGATGVEWASEAAAEGGWTESGTDLYPSDATKVGVGTTSPRRKLDVEGSDDVPQVRLTYTDNTHYADFSVSNNGTLLVTPSSRTMKVDTGDSNGGNLEFSKSGGIKSGGITWDTGDKDVTVYSEADLYLGAGGNSQKVIIDNGGNVGIGVTDPDTQLEVFNGASTQLKLSFDGTDNCTLGVDTNGMLTITPSGGQITNTASNGVINSAALMSKGPHTHPDRFVKNTAAPTHGSGTTANWAFVDSSNYTNSQLTAPSTSANAIRLFKWQPSAAYTDGKNYAIVLPTLDATWTSSSNYLRYRVVIQQDTAMSSVSTGVQLQLGAAGGSDTINGSTSNYVIKNIAVTNPSAYDWTVDVIGYFDGSKTIWEVVQHAQWG